MEIEFSTDITSVLPAEVGLTLLRVVQEAMFNAMKYSGVKRAAVELVEQSSEIQLIISDSGRGFDVGEAERGRGLGLTSMRERVRLVNGRITIYSKSMSGTRVEVHLPFRSVSNSQRAAV
jgi:signal transduction histidine kinase